MCNNYAVALLLTFEHVLVAIPPRQHYTLHLTRATPTMLVPVLMGMWSVAVDSRVVVIGSQVICRSRRTVVLFPSPVPLSSETMTLPRPVDRIAISSI